MDLPAAVVSRVEAEIIKVGNGRSGGRNRRRISMSILMLILMSKKCFRGSADPASKLHFAP